MTTQNTEYEHNEEHDANGVDETVVAQQHISDTSTTDETTPTSDSSAPERDVSYSNDPSSESNNNTSAIEQTSLEESPSVATTTFAEETGNTIPEISSFFVSADDLQEPTTEEQAPTTSTEDTQNMQDTLAPSPQEVLFSSPTEDEQMPVAQAETASVTNTEANVQQPETTSSNESTEETEEPVAPVAHIEGSNPETVDAVASPVFVEESETATSEIAPEAEASEETVRPFTAFIEEFHQAQAEAEAQAEAHLTASLQDAQVQAFSEFAAPEIETTAVDQPISLEDALPPVDFGEGSAFVPNSDGVTTVDVADVNSQSLAEAAVDEENQRATASETERTEETLPATQAPERPVSPLLRPALRPRARHGAARHRDESITATPHTTEARTTAEETTAQPVQVASNAPEQSEETAKPARRYRFDRKAPQAAQTTQTGATVNKPTTSVSTNNGGVLTPPPATQPTPTFARVEESLTPASKTPTASAPIPNIVEATESGEILGTESTDTFAAPIEQGKRRHGTERQERPSRQEREKEQSAPPVVAPQSVADTATAVVNESNGTEDVAPEDMPPLEYADLQKANSSRRRRRHRTTTAATPPTSPTTATPPTAKENGTSTNGTSTNGTQQSAPLAPVAPITSAPQNGKSMGTEAQTTPYTITSGYTVGQMNQGNEQKGPFMGPEPSPARGSVNTTRDGRTVRVESQPQRSAPYQTRAVEGMLPAAAMNHFANIVSQAIQTQSDRMVAELRRANQAPTNVSVSLPAFPSTERVGVFVDVANLLYSARTQRIAIDFGKLLDFLRGNRRLVRAHAYCPTSPQPGDEQMFLTAVKGLGYRITTKNYKTFASGAKKADLDLDLCMDVVRIVDGKAVDAIVLVSGDSDFMPMLDYCSDHGVRVEVAAFDEAMSATLRQSCDLFINLSMLEEIRA